MKKRFLTLMTLLLLVILHSCTDSTGPDKVYDRGEVISSRLILTLTADELTTLLADNGFTFDYTLQYQVSAFSVNYQSEDANGNNIELSGAIIIPSGIDEPPMISLNHGTVTKRNQAASVFPFYIIEGAMGMITASLGYVTLVPDYPGFGTSTELHPYIHAKSLAISVIDFIRAGRNFCQKTGITLNEKLFLGGYSEGGYVTMAAQREIETNYSDEMTLTAVAPMAGPHNLSWMAHHVLAKETYENPAYLAFMITAYDHVYGWQRLSEIFNEPYASAMPGYFDGTKTYGEINGALPTAMSALFKSSFLSGFQAGTETAMENALAENTLLGWDPVAPIRMYHGDADSTVFYKNSADAKIDFESRGATNVELIVISGGTHVTAGEAAFMGMISWFSTF
jgi:alpha-beta hydrolase superfamily lysophospholipase